MNDKDFTDFDDDKLFAEVLKKIFITYHYYFYEYCKKTKPAEETLKNLIESLQEDIIGMR